MNEPRHGFPNKAGVTAENGGAASEGASYTDLNARIIDSWIEDGWEWGMQFSHTLDEQIRGQILAGLRIVDLYEDTGGEGRLHELGIPTFWATCAEKPLA